MENVIIKSDNLTAEIKSIGAEIVTLKYMGQLIGTKGGVKGRCANRIRGAKFILNGKEYRLSANVAPNHLHGGEMGFSKLPWDLIEQGENYARYRLISKDGDMGYPGTLIIDVKYSLDADSLQIEFFAESDQDTILNPVNHLYFNLNETHSSVDHNLVIDSDKIIETGEGFIPSGRLLDVSNTRYDFRSPKLIEGHYDNSYALDLDIEKRGFRSFAFLIGNLTGITVEAQTDRPCMQLYNTEEEICLETQAYPDAINHPEFPSNILKKGDKFYSKTKYILRKLK